jgi:hypothetical protein
MFGPDVHIGGPRIDAPHQHRVTDLLLDYEDVAQRPGERSRSKGGRLGRRGVATEPGG